MNGVLYEKLNNGFLFGTLLVISLHEFFVVALQLEFANV